MNDLSPLAELTSLEVLRLDGTLVSDLTPLAKLKNLKVLVLYDTPVDRVFLTGTKANDLSPLAGLKNLKVLWLDTSPVHDLSPLTGLTNLNNLSLFGIRVSLGNVHELQMALPNCEIANMTNISPNWTNPISLSFFRSQIEQVQKLQQALRGRRQ